MPDDDISDPTEGISEGSDSSTEDTEGATPIPSPKESEEPTQEPATQASLEEENKAIAEHMNNFKNGSAQREQFFQNEIAPFMKNYQDISNEPTPTPPRPPEFQPPNAQPSQPPDFQPPGKQPPDFQPPSKQQQGAITESVFNLLKFGALLGIAYGMGGRGKWRNTMTKTALAAAISGYAQGNAERSNAGLKLWEKNNELLQKDYSDRDKYYNDILKDKRLRLDTQAHLIKQWADLWKDQRAADAAERRDFDELDKHMMQRQRILRAYQKDHAKSRKPLYELMGKGKEALNYSMWVVERSGGKENPMTETDPSKQAKIQADNPWSEFLKHEEAHAPAKGSKKTSVLSPKADDPYNLGDVNE